MPEYFAKRKVASVSRPGIFHFANADPNPLHYYPSDPVFFSDTIWWMQNCFSHIRAYSSCKAHWLLGLILALLCASWSGALGFPALLHAVLMLSGAGTQHWVLLCFPLQIQTSSPYIVQVESPPPDAHSPSLPHPFLIMPIKRQHFCKPSRQGYSLIKHIYCKLEEWQN